MLAVSNEDVEFFFRFSHTAVAYNISVFAEYLKCSSYAQFLHTLYNTSSL